MYGYVVRLNEILTEYDPNRSPFRIIYDRLLKLSKYSNTVDARQAINQLMNLTYYGGSIDSIELYGDSIYYKEEELNDYDYLNKVCMIYSEYDIHSIFGLSLKDFLDMTPYDHNILISNALIIMEIKSKREEEMLNKIKNRENGLKKSVNDLGDIDGYG